MRFFVYMLECSNGTFYTGNTSNLEFRISQHISGYDPKSYTYELRPVTQVWAQEFPTRVDALNAEKQIKGWSHVKKRALIEHDFEKIHQIVKRRGEKTLGEEITNIHISQISERRP